MTHDKFLSELTELSKKYKVVVSGCGCCGSPYLVDIEQHECEGHYSQEEEETEPSSSDLQWVTWQDENGVWHR